MNDYDQTCRYIVKLDPVAHYQWLLGEEAPLCFRDWYDTRTVANPGTSDRTGDVVALLAPQESTDPTAALITEFQTENDEEILERLLEEIARYRRELRTRTIDVFGLVVNLTGPKQASELRMELPGNPAIGLKLTVLVRTLREESAADLLAAIASGRLSKALLPWIPLLRGSGEPAIIQQWKQLAESEPNPIRRASYGSLALIWLRLLPEPVRQAWHSILKEFNVNESPVIKEWRNEGRVEGRIDSRREDVLKVVQLRFRTAVPPELTAALRATNDLPVLDHWFEAAVTATTLDEFRAAVGH